MRLHHVAALLTVVLGAGCGGRVAGTDDLDDGDDRNAAVDQTSNDRLTVLRSRCAGPWKGSTSTDPGRNAALAAGRWLRCPDDSGSAPAAFVGTFDAIELTSDKAYFRLTVGRNGFERTSTELGDQGRWMVMRNGQLTFDLPACDQGYVSTGKVTKCGGVDIVDPMFESSPARMRFYGATFWYVKDE